MISPVTDSPKPILKRDTYTCLNTTSFLQRIVGVG